MGALSLGCGTCKGRKVKCDANHPRCRRCSDAGIECAGYTPRLRFVDEGPRVRRSIAARHARSHEFAVISRNSPSPCRSSQSQSSQPYGPTPLLANALPLTAFRDNIFISYLFFTLVGNDGPRSPNTAGDAQCGFPRHWIPEFIETSPKPRQKSWDALSAIVFGRAHNSHDSITSAVGLYGQALSELRNRLSDPRNRYADSTLASMTALYKYEMLASETGNGWLLHAGGLGLLLESRGPDLQKPCAGKAIFLEHRILLLSKSMVSRQSTFLSHSAWKTVPWEDEPASKSDIDHLLDTGADIAEYMSIIKTRGNGENDLDSKHSMLAALVAKSLKDLNAWWRQWEVDHAQPAIEVTYPSLTDKCLFPTVLEYDMPWTAFTICIYDAMRILLLQLWNTLQLLSSSARAMDQGTILDMPNSTPLLGITSNVTNLACEIMRSLRYSYRQGRQFILTGSFLFIQDVAYGCFDPSSKEAAWISRHGWAEDTNIDNFRDANILRRLLPLGQIKASNVGTFES